MRIARVNYEGQPRAAVITGDAARVLASEIESIDLLSAKAAERDQLADHVDAELPLSEVSLLAPLQPSTIRDFSVFEQHIEGVVKDGNPEAKVPAVCMSRRSATSPTRMP